MAIPLDLPHFPSTPPTPPPSSSSSSSSIFLSGSSTISSTIIPPHLHHHSYNHPTRPTFSCSCRRFYGEDEDAVNYGFLFNQREYYKCHDYLEHLWIRAEEPFRTLFHGILQCAVGFHHLFNQNHKGAMMELGEGLCKLRKMNFQDGPFHQFER